MKELGGLKCFLGMEIVEVEKGIFISQRKYTLDLLKETSKLGCRPARNTLRTKLEAKNFRGRSTNESG